MQIELELRDYFRIIMKRKSMIAAIVIICTIAAGLYSYYMVEPVYEATTKIVVNRTEAAGVTSNDLVNEVNANLRLIDTYKEIIKTPAIMEVVAEQHPEFGMTAEDLIKKVKVSSVNNTQVMTMVVQDLSYKKAAEVVNAVSQAFKDQIPNIFNVKNVTILNLADITPSKEPAPVNAKLKLNIILAFMVSLLAAAGIAFLLEYMDDTIKTEADVLRYLELPTVGQIAKVKNEHMNQEDAVRTRHTKAGGEISNVQVGK